MTKAEVEAHMRDITDELNERIYDAPGTGESITELERRRQAVAIAWSCVDSKHYQDYIFDSAQ